MGNLLTGAKKLTPKTATPTSHTEPSRVYIPIPQSDKPAAKSVEEKLREDDKIKSSDEDSLRSKDDSEPPITQEQKEAMLRFAIKKLKGDEFTAYDFGINDESEDKCKKKDKKKACKGDISSDSDDEKQPCVHKKNPCIKQKKPCIKEGKPYIKEKEESFEEESDDECPEEVEQKQPVKVKSKEAPKTTESKKPEVKPPCTEPKPIPSTPPILPPPPTAEKEKKGASGPSPGSKVSVKPSIPKLKLPKFPKGSGMGQSGGKMIGDYPVEYNAKVHGPYDPARYYGKPDTPFGQVKIGELGAWLGRRNKHPSALIAAVSRAHWRWQHKYLLAKRATAAPLMQFVVATMIFSYSINRYKIQHQYHYKYH